MVSHLRIRSTISKHQNFSLKWIMELNSCIYLESNYFETGSVNSYILNYKQMLREKADIHKVFSSINEHARLGYRLFDRSKGNQTASAETILYLNELFISENKRGQGIGTDVLKLLPSHVRNLTGNHLTHIFLYPFPLNKTENGIVIPDRHHSEKAASLKKFYSKNGFSEIGTGDFGTYLYIKEISLT